MGEKTLIFEKTRRKPAQTKLYTDGFGWHIPVTQWGNKMANNDSNNDATAPLTPTAANVHQTVDNHWTLKRKTVDI